MLETSEKINIDLHFDKQALNKILNPDTYKPESLVELFRKGVQGMTPPIFDRGGHVGFHTSAEHALKVLLQFETYYSQNPLPGNTDPNLFRVTLVLHDIGYPLGGRYGQHQFTEPMTQAILQRLDFTDTEINRVLALISKDPLGYYFTQEPGFEFAEDAMIVVREKAKEAGMSFEEFFELLVIFYSCDASSYRHLNYLFKMNSEARKIDYCGNVEAGMRNCREVLAEVLKGVLIL